MPQGLPRAEDLPSKKDCASVQCALQAHYSTHYTVVHLFVFCWLVIGVLQALRQTEDLPSVEFGVKRKTELQVVPYNNEH